VVSFSFDVNTNSNASDSNKQITHPPANPLPERMSRKKYTKKTFLFLVLKSLLAMQLFSALNIP
jgi:hypothetical protein